MNISQTGINLIKSFEGCRLRAYKDVAGIWTIGYGHTAGVKSGDTITQVQADNLLKNDLKTFENYVNMKVCSPITQNMFDALVSFTYNVGCSAFGKSTLCKEVNNKRYDIAAGEFDKWVHAGGKKVQGLVNRRNKEKELFMSDMPKSTDDGLPYLRGYRGYSIVDGLKSFGYESSFTYRKEIWSKMGKTSAYKGTTSQNTTMLNFLKNH